MNKFKFYFIAMVTAVSIFSCTKDEPEIPVTPPRAFADQYKEDIALIKDYLTTYYIKETKNNPGKVDDQDITFAKIDGGQRSIMSYLNASTYPKLLVRLTKIHNVDYELYYLVLRPGIGASPTNVDGVLTAYRGSYLNRTLATATPPSELTNTFFQEERFPQSYFQLYTVQPIPLRAWSEILPQFKTGTSKTNEDGTVTHSDFGAGVMFIPSGLGYYNLGADGIPAYAPLIFSFKLYNIERSDQDNDGVLSFHEDLINDSYIYDYRNTINYPTTPADQNIRYADDTDEDGIPDFLDTDDDGDNFSTRIEITKPAGIDSGLSLYFPFDAIADDPLTPVIETETKGIPSYKTDKTLDYITAGRLRVHRDKSYPVKK